MEAFEVSVRACRWVLQRPLTWSLDVLVGQLAWLIRVLVVSTVDAWLPYRRAADLPIALALAEV